MVPDPVLLAPDDLLPNAPELTADNGFSHLPVVDEDDQIVGIVLIRDLCVAVKEQLEEDVRQYGSFILDTGYGSGA